MESKLEEKYSRKEPKVSIVFLNWNGKKNSLELLNSFKKISYRNYEIIIVDNGSKDGSQKELREKADKNVTIIENKRNLGEAEGLNVGIRKALSMGSAYVLIMDNDMYVDKNFLKIMIESMERHPEVAVAGPKIYYSNPDDVIWSAGCDYHLRGFRSRYQKQKDTGQAEKQEYVDAADCVLLMRGEILRELGVLRGEFFTMHEMTEWCLRASVNGYKILYIPKAKIWHKVSATWDKIDKMGKMSLYYDTRNWLFCIRLDKNPFYFIAVLFSELTGLFIARSIRWIKTKQLGLVGTYLLSIWHGLTGQTPVMYVPK
ncbi:MAG TPA: glycosyltransferase family 2 protein [Candidatus Omnitrophota bacterium]|nr:glycosyltransferase family 2 protein [Candidatus Omnitrophota bacterium]